ncbi:hypothetical protein PMIN05_009884 [Paraphaeosphaeria minitans]
MPRAPAASEIEVYLGAREKARETPTLGRLVEAVAPVGLADGAPTAASRVRRGVRSMRSLSSGRSVTGEGDTPVELGRGRGEERPGSGVMVEEKGVGSEDGSGDERRSGSFRERLGVPG